MGWGWLRAPAGMQRLLLRTIYRAPWPQQRCHSCSTPGVCPTPHGQTRRHAANAAHMTAHGPRSGFPCTAISLMMPPNIPAG